MIEKNNFWYLRDKNDYYLKVKEVIDFGKSCVEFRFELTGNINDAKVFDSKEEAVKCSDFLARNLGMFNFLPVRFDITEVIEK